MKTIYLISGLGSDQRIFQYIDISGHKLVFIKWIDPQPGESIESYAKRLTEQITTPKPILLGLSFGGILAIEIAKQIETEKVILISSAKTKSEIPFYYRLGGKLRLHKLIPIKMMKRANKFGYWLFSIKHPKEKELLFSIFRDIDDRLYLWSVEKIVTWKNETQIENLIHIHGTADRTLPFRFIHADRIIKGAGHLMIVSRAKEINKILSEILAE